MNPTERLFSSHSPPLLPCHKVKLLAVSLRDTTLFHGALACILSRQSVQNNTSRLSLFQQKSVKSFSNRSANFSSPVALDRHVFVSMVLQAQLQPMRSSQNMFWLVELVELRRRRCCPQENFRFEYGSCRNTVPEGNRQDFSLKQT